MLVKIGNTERMSQHSSIELREIMSDKSQIMLADATWNPVRGLTMPEKLIEPLEWKKPRHIVVNSMSDLFHEDVPDAFIDSVFAVMAQIGRAHV